ncbi:malate dehydrogenase (oxaloacetate-decarboxylating)(NADP+) [Wenyingzhuangia heitensis]|uniref:Malate dehydrogenase (Oxaloacetate-decarboxylating)(NADP+) n=1 Tax=Wenyingzhuangia heitensis TaxID=1487859 RepID=A0ABX0U8B0_9FLAO|nr:NADP-dependent malic enzyme [Wenyingzhuangia heitensis]NIJ44005.1 malate dehydrogenase (oxaloacetate-decarboxylating)(NADP+) [Wenyingzhuangia heitensis]
MSYTKKELEALEYHEKPQPGKIKVVPTKRYATQRDLALAYSPGVAVPCLAIEKNPEDAYKYTSKGNLVAVISNGTAVLGLGNIGALAGKPVMEGKGLLFKIFADIDVFDIEVDTTDVDKFIETVKMIAPTFGGINLEDIKAPEAFEIERRLKEELDIPVMHDDQHGTAIISAAALKNAVEIAEKDITKVRVVVNGAGAAAISCTKLYKALGVAPENILMCDSKGVISTKREDLNEQKQEFAVNTEFTTLEEAINGADVFIGLSVAGALTPEMLKTMAPDPIVFAMANPTPEIDYDVAVATRKDVIMATGRSDYPNQVNNVLGFPFIFRGALDVRATGINEEMKMAAVHALADMAKKNVPEQVNIVYGEKNLQYGREYIIPKPFDPRLIHELPPAIAKAAMDSGIAKKPIKDWDAYTQELMERSGSGSKFERMLVSRSQKDPKRVVFPEAEHLNVLKAAQIVSDEGIARPILLGNVELIKALKEEIGFEAEVEIIDPKSDEYADKVNVYAEKYWAKRQRKGIRLLDAQKHMITRNYFAAMMVNEGEADAMVSGYSRNYPSTVKPIFETIGKRPGASRIAAANIMITEKGPLIFTDTTVNIEPSSEVLANIAELASGMAKIFAIEPHIAMLSYTNFGGVESAGVAKVQKAVEILKAERPDLNVDGPIQADFALNHDLLEKQFSFSDLVGSETNTFIFPSLEAANISYKMIKELTDATSIGPVLMGLNKPAHVVQLGASVEEIVNITAVAVIDAQNQ